MKDKVGLIDFSNLCRQVSQLQTKVDHNFMNIVEATKSELRVQMQEKATAQELEQVRDSKASVQQVEELNDYINSLKDRLQFLEDEHDKA